MPAMLRSCPVCWAQAACSWKSGIQSPSKSMLPSVPSSGFGYGTFHG